MTLTLSRHAVLDADARVSDRDFASPSQLHQTLFSAGLERSLLDAVEEIPGESPDEMRAAIPDEIDALDGFYLDLVVSAAAATRWVKESPDDERGIRNAEKARQDLVDATRALGNGTPLGIRSSLDDIPGGAVAVLQVASLTPRVEISLTGRWASCRPQARRDILDLVIDLAMGCEVTLVATGIARRRIEEEHRDQVPHLTSACNPRPHNGPSYGRTRAREAVASLTRGGTSTSTAILRALAESPSGSRSYGDLRRDLRLEDADDSLIPQTARRLEGRHGLAERIERPDGTVVLSLLPAGLEVVERLREDDDIRQQSSTSWTETEPDDSPPKISLPCRVTPASQDGGEGDPANEAEDARPVQQEAAETTDSTDYQHGWVGVEFMGRSRHVAAGAASEPGSVTIIDAIIDRDDDGRRPWWSFDADRDELIVGAEYYNPMQLWVALSRSLASDNTLSLLDERLDDDLRGLELTDRPLLRDARCLGWLSDDDSTEDFIDALRDGRETLLGMTSDFKSGLYDNRNQARSSILRAALGLAGTMVHLLDLLDIDVVREIRVPDFSRNYSRKKARQDLAKTIAIGAAIQSRYGHFAAFRHLFESREQKRERSIEPEIRPDKTGDLIGSFVLVGDGLSGMQDEFASYLDGPAELHPDAPEFGVPIPLKIAGRQETARAVIRMLDIKNIRPSREAVDILHGFASDVFSVAQALNRALSDEDRTRPIHLDEVRRSLSVLDEDRLLPDLPRSARRGIAVLLDAERPISQAELARRADISAQSWRNHRDKLVELDIVAEVEEGWRICLPFRDERGESLDILPWFMVETDRLPSRSRRWTDDVLVDLAFGGFDFGDEPPPVTRLLYSGVWPPDIEDVEAVIDELGVRPWWRLLSAVCDDRGLCTPPSNRITMGRIQTVQTALPTG